MSPRTAAVDLPTELLNSPDDLVTNYRPDQSFFFASPRGILLADGELATVGQPAPGDGRGWAAAAAGVRAALSRAAWTAPASAVAGTGTADGGRGSEPLVPPLAVGVVPFDPTQPGRLVVPARVRRAGPFEPTSDRTARHPRPAAAPDGAVDGAVVGAVDVPSAQWYTASVQRALDAMGAGDLDKVVLARTMRVPGAVDPSRVLRALADADPHAYLFAARVPLTETEPRTLLGASPELLVSRTGSLVVSNPLAGSARRGADPVSDRENAVALLASGKDRREHQVVVAAVAEALRPFCVGLDVPSVPSLVRTATMWHLSTRISGWLADPAVSSLELAAAVHPTPAVCGWPTEAARSMISELEPFDRGCYSGLVGWCDAAGDGEWALAIRCAEVTPTGVRMFAGAGIVPGSDPAAELAETTAKFATFGGALGVGVAG